MFKTIYFTYSCTFIKPLILYAAIGFVVTYNTILMRLEKELNNIQNTIVVNYLLSLSLA